MFGVRTDRYKYIFDHDVWDANELYDLKADPLEVNSLIRSAEHRSIISDYLFTERIPLNDEVVGILTEKSKLLARKSIAERVKDKILDFIETFFDDVPVVE